MPRCTCQPTAECVTPSLLYTHQRLGGEPGSEDTSWTRTCRRYSGAVTNDVKVSPPFLSPAGSVEAHE